MRSLKKKSPKCVLFHHNHNIMYRKMSKMTRRIDFYDQTSVGKYF